MQAPKDGDAFAAAASELKALQGERKRLDGPVAQASGQSSFVTSDRGNAHGQKVLMDQFARGMREGADPYIFTAKSRANSDVMVYGMGEATVEVSGLELIQATDPEGLGYAKGQALRLAYCAVERESPRPTHVVVPDVPRETPVPAAPQVVAWSGGASPEGDYGMVRLNLPDGGREVAYVRVDVLATVMHELAGQASMCWEPRPKGVFDSTACLGAVAGALRRLGV